MSMITLVAAATNFINGEMNNLTAKGKGSVADGTVYLDWSFSKEVEGFPLAATVPCTSFGTSLHFAMQNKGGLNMNSLCGGNYKFYRVFDFGEYGTYDLRAEIRTSGKKMTANGVTVGSMKLPNNIIPPTSLVEVMYQAAPREMRSFMQVTFTTEKGKEIPGAVSCVYSPISQDEDDWTRKVKHQIRRSFIKTTKTNGAKLSTLYATIIESIGVPAYPKSESFLEAK